MTKILVPLDFSNISSNALYYAIQLFQDSKPEITLLHAYGTWSTAMTIKNIDRMIERDSNRTLKELMAKVQKEYPDLILKPRILKDHAVEAIAELGDSGDYDFIVMGTKGASGLQEVFLGSVAGGVISKTTAPVIVVPAGFEFKPLDEIVLALSNDPVSDKKVGEPLRKLATMHQSNVKVLHIAEEGPEEVERALADFNDLNPSFDYAMGTEDINKDLNDYLSQGEASLLCMIRKHHGFASRIFKDSVTLKQTFDSPVPLLILQDRD